MRTALSAIALIAAALTGCSQAAQLQPVAGAQISAVRTATNAVLVERGVEIEVAPVCAFEDPLFICRGTTIEGEEIVSQAEVISEFGATETEYGAYTPADVSLVVTVGAGEIFRGNVEDVLVDEGQVSQ